jgi:DNA-binding GntR family transcriptional regulator
MRHDPARPRQTAAARIHRLLRDDIVQMRRQPGDAISEKDIAAAAGVSRTPVREALLRLVDEGLVEIAPKSGTYVARIPVDALPEAIIARLAIEQTAARAAAERAAGSAVAALRATLERQRECVAAGDRDGFHAADEALHRGIAEAARLPGLWPMVQQIKTQLDRYRHLTLPQPGRIGRVLIEHAAIVDAIARRDADAAAEAVALHLAGLAASLTEIRAVNPEHFIGDIEAVSFASLPVAPAARRRG